MNLPVDRLLLLSVAQIALVLWTYLRDGLVKKRTDANVGVCPAGISRQRSVCFPWERPCQLMPCQIRIRGQTDGYG